MPRQKRPHLKRQKDGRYHCTYKGHPFAARTEAEAYAKRDEYKRMIESGVLENPTVAEYAAQWLPLHKSGVSVKTYNDYAQQLDRLTAVIGNQLFPSVTVDDAMRVYRQFSKFSQSTIKRARMLYIALFDTARENGYCQRNVFRSKFAQPEKGTEGTHRIITQEERDLILNTPHRMRLAAMTMLYAGLRRGEALAIQIDRDVDFESSLIHVDKAVRFDGNAPVLTKTKTASGRRDVPLFPILADALRGQSGWLIASVDGKQATETAFSRGWQSYLSALSAAANHPVKIRCHDLRHSFCTMLRDAGVDMKLAMLWMGHADEKMILRIYDHITDERAAENAEKVQKRLLSLQNPLQPDPEPSENPDPAPPNRNPAIPLRL